jgi:hypothetical protein
VMPREFSFLSFTPNAESSRVPLNRTPQESLSVVTISHVSAGDEDEVRKLA